MAKEYETFDQWKSDTSIESETAAEYEPIEQFSPTTKPVNRRKIFSQGFGITDEGVDYSKEGLKQLLGDSFVDEDFVDAPGDLWLTTEIGFADTEEKKRQIIKEKYPDGDYRVRTFGDGETVETATKDGKTWKILSGSSQIIGSLGVGETAGSLLMSASPQAGLLMKALKPAVGAGLGKAAEEFGAKLFGYEEPGRDSILGQAGQSFAINAAAGAAAEGILTPLVHRTVGVKGTEGAMKAATAAARQAELEPLTRGQFSSNKVFQSAYRQIQNYNISARKEAMKRFASMKDSLGAWVDEYGVKDFGNVQLQALQETAAKNVDSIVKDLQTGAKPFGQVVGKLQDALKVFRKSNSEIKNRAYADAFEIANRDMIEFDFGGVHKVFDDIERGVPVKGQTVPAPGAGDLGVAGPVEGSDVVRYLTPEAKLQGMINKARQVNPLLSPHNPDGNYVSALEQMNAIRREFSEFAWENAENLQGQKASDVIRAIDESLEKPVSGYSDAYKEAYANAQSRHAAWKTALDLKKIVNLNNADPTTYENFIVGIMKPGNGPTLKLMDDMFQADPSTMDAVRSTYFSFLQKNPSKIPDTIKDLQKNDPDMFGMVFKNPADADTLIKYGREKERLDNSWFVKQADLEYITEGQKIVDMLSGNPENMAKRVSDYIHFKGPDGKKSIRTALIHNLIKESETIPTDELGKSVVSANEFIKAHERYKDLIGQVFSPAEQERLLDHFNYALKIKDTEMGLPGAAKSFGDSLAIASAGGQVVQSAAKVEKSSRSLLEATGKALKDTYFAINMSPQIIDAIVGFSKPRTGKVSRGVLTEEGLQSITNFVRVAPAIYVNANSRYEQQEQTFESYENVYTP